MNKRNIIITITYILLALFYDAATYAQTITEGRVNTDTIDAKTVTKDILIIDTTVFTKPVRMKGGFYYDVTAFGATGDSSADDKSAIQSAIDAAPNGGVVFFPKGIYKVGGAITIFYRHNLKLLLDPKAKIIACDTGWSSTSSVISIGHGCTDLTIEGGIIDANQLATWGISIVPTSYSTDNTKRVWIKNCEITGTKPGVNHDGIYVTAAYDTATVFTVTDIHVEHCYIHDVGFCGVSFRDVMNCSVENCLITNTGDSATAISIPTIGAIIRGNTISKFRSDVQAREGSWGKGISGFNARRFTIENNVIDADTSRYTQGIYLDTPFDGVIANNTVKNSGDGINIEVGRSVTITGNSIFDVKKRGMNIYGRPDSVIVDSLNSLTNLFKDANVDTSLDHLDFREGNASVVCSTKTAFSTGLLFRDSLVVNGRWDLHPLARLWVKPNKLVNRGELQLWVASDSAMVGVHTKIDFPQILANQWVKLEFYDEKMSAAWGVVPVKYWGINATTDPGTLSIKMDALMVDVANDNNVITGNTIFRTGCAGIVIGNQKQFVCSNNTIRDAGITRNFTESGTYDYGVGIHLSSGSYHGVDGGIIANNVISSQLFQTDHITGIRLDTTQTSSGYINNILIAQNQLYNVTTPFFYDSDPTNIKFVGNVTDDTTATVSLMGKVGMGSLSLPDSQLTVTGGIHATKGALISGRLNAGTNSTDTATITGTVRVTNGVYSTGNSQFSFGTTDATNTGNSVLITRQYDGSSSLTASGRALSVASFINGSGGGPAVDAIGVTSKAELHQSGTDPYAFIVGGNFNANVTSSASASNAYGVNVRARMDSTGNISTWNGFRVEKPTYTDSGYITGNAIGLYIDTQKVAGKSTTGWGVYQVSNNDKNFLSGLTQMGSGSGADSQLTINGGLHTTRGAAFSGNVSIGSTTPADSQLTVTGGLHVTQGTNMEGELVLQSDGSVNPPNSSQFSFVTDKYMRMRYSDYPYYRSDFAVSDAGTFINSYDDDANEYRPMYLEGSQVGIYAGGATHSFQSDGLHLDTDGKIIFPDGTYDSTADRINRVDTVVLKNQTGSISAANLNRTSVMGGYTIGYYISCTTAGSGGTVTLTLDWDNGTKQTTSTSIVLTSTTSYASGNIFIYNVPVSSSSIRYSTTVSGATGSPKYQAIISVKREL